MPRVSRASLSTVFAVVLGVALCVPSLGIGLLLDDHVIRIFVQSHMLFGGPGALDMFRVYGRGGSAEIAQLIDSGTLPWWTLPELSIALFRPLAVATHYFDFWAWPAWPAAMHAQNLLWYAWIVALAGALYRRLQSSVASAVLALGLYAVDEAHAEAAAWIAGRNTLMMAAFVLAALLCHVRARSEDWRGGRVLAPLALLAAFASGEGAIAAWALLVPYALFLDRGPWRARAIALVPLALTSAGWLVLYRALGYGTHGSGVYCDPLDAPRYFFEQRVPTVYPLVLRELLALPSAASVRVLWLKAPWVGVASGFAIAIAATVLVTRARRDRAIAFWLSAFFASILPLCTITVAPRLLFLPSLAGFALIAEFVVGSVRRARGGLGRALFVAASGYFVLVHGVLALVLAPHAPEALVGYERVLKSSAAHVPLRGGAENAFVLSTPNYFITALAAVYAPPGAWPPRAYVLASSVDEVRVTRVERDALAIEPRGGFLRELTSRVLRSPEYRFVQGQQIAIGAMRATVETITRDGRPSRVRFELHGLDGAQNLWLAWRRDRYARVELPAVGASVTLPGF